MNRMFSGSTLPAARMGKLISNTDQSILIGPNMEDGEISVPVGPLHYDGERLWLKLAPGRLLQRLLGI